MARRVGSIVKVQLLGAVCICVCRCVRVGEKKVEEKGRDKEMFSGIFFSEQMFGLGRHNKPCL